MINANQLGNDYDFFMLQYPEATGLHHSWYNKGRKRALERCQCMQLQYRHHLGWFKKIVGFILVSTSLLVLIWNEVLILIVTYITVSF